MDPRPDVVFLGEPASFEVALVGAKAANLGLLAADFPVPAGFCLTTEVFARLATAGDAARDQLRALVAPAYERLSNGNGLKVVVRSSAIGEDSAGASFAGQHDTFLDVSGVDAVTDAVIRCWASLGADRAVAYRERQGLAAGAMPVLVQRLVPAEAAAVAFSADPLTGERGVVRVNVARGLGEALVSGAVTPDAYLVAKDGLTVRERKLANTAATIDDATVVEIARLATALEERFGRPVDVELAVANRSVHVVQCRPITTLPEPFEVRWPDPSFARLSWSRDLLHEPVAFPPLSADNSLLTTDSTRETATYFLSPFRGRAIQMNGYLYGASEWLVEDEEELAGRLAAANEKRRAFGRKLPAFWERKILPYLREMYAWMEEAPLETATPAEAAALWQECWARLLRAWQLHFYIVGTAYPVLDELASMYDELFPGRSGIEALGLTRGITNEIHEMQAELYDLAETARSAGEDDPAFRSAYTRFVERHGHLGHTYNDMRLPSWSDEPERVLEQVRKRAEMPGQDPR
ncbi:MAG: PEP/pyruvate-binding domain-containing protein, partial [Candidatus Limnocylindria bacterium]